MESVPHPSSPAALPAPAAPRTLGLSWPLLVVLATFFGLLVQLPVNKILGDGDTYWHIAAGRWIAEHGTVPHSDPFSHSMPGAPWTAHEWLAEVVMQAVHGAAGWAGLVTLTATALALTLALLTRFLMRRMEPVHALLLVALAAAMSLSHVLARPHVLAWPLLMLWVATLVNAGEARRGPPWWLLGVMLLWANLHGSFTIGLALGAALALDAVLAQPQGQRRQLALRWAAFVALSALAALLTPFGVEAVEFTLHVMSLKVALAAIGEWQSPNFHLLQPFLVWLLLMLGLGLSGCVRLPWVRLLLLVGLVYLALKHQRNIALLGMVSPLLLAVPLARGLKAATSGASDAAALDRWFRALAQPSRWGARVAGLCVVALLVAGVLPAREPRPEASITPQRAVEAALAAGAQGPVFNDYGFGGYLIYRGIPVHIDGRADMYGDRFLQDTIDAMQLKDRRGFLAFLERHGFGWSLLLPGTPAVALLDELPGWRRVYADDDAVVHVCAGARRP
ncbi:hypothetical protein [Azohydromonas australica]|uniref:hypothetical protein n=1 Tax=Azohydromonas australica TaxID=364039 RepID=UPI0004225981|nr:hypothetical protein [Azohydromonas australica]